MAILVVDDSKTIRFVLNKVLGELGYDDVIEAGSVAVAKRYLEVKKIDLVFSDWHMPKETGLDLLQHIRSIPEFAKLPFVMITTEQDKQRIFQAAKVGLQSYIYKPIQKDVLAQKLQELSTSHGIKPPKTNK